MQQLPSGLFLPDPGDKPDLKALYDPNWNLLDGVIPDNVTAPQGVRSVRTATPGASKRAAPIDHGHPGSHGLTGGYGFSKVAEHALWYYQVPVADTVIYTAPADVQFSIAPLVNVQNGANPSTITFKINGVVVSVSSLGAVSTTNALLPPMLPGDQLTAAASVSGPTYIFGTVYEIRDPSWKISKVLNLPINVGTAVYTCPNGITGARSFYSAFVINPIYVVGPTAGTVYTQYKANGQNSVNIGNGAMSANKVLQPPPVMLSLAPGDLVMVYPQAAGVNAWIIVQEYTE